MFNSTQRFIIVKTIAFMSLADFIATFVDVPSMPQMRLRSQSKGGSVKCCIPWPALVLSTFRVSRPVPITVTTRMQS